MILLMQVLHCWTCQQDHVQVLCNSRQKSDFKFTLMSFWLSWFDVSMSEKQLYYLSLCHAKLHLRSDSLRSGGVLMQINNKEISLPPFVPAVWPQRWRHCEPAREKQSSCSSRVSVPVNLNPCRVRVPGPGHTELAWLRRGSKNRCEDHCLRVSGGGVGFSLSPCCWLRWKIRT